MGNLSADTFQTEAAYSVMDRSDEKKPLRAVFSKDMEFHRFRSAQT